MLVWARNSTASEGSVQPWVLQLVPNLSTSPLPFGVGHVKPLPKDKVISELNWLFHLAGISFLLCLSSQVPTHCLRVSLIVLSSLSAVCRPQYTYSRCSRITEYAIVTPKCLLTSSVWLSPSMDHGNQEYVNFLKTGKNFCATIDLGDSILPMTSCFSVPGKLQSLTIRNLKITPLLVSACQMKKADALQNV